VEQLGDHEVGDGVVQRTVEEHDPVGEQPRVDVERPLPSLGLLDHGGHQQLGHRTLLGVIYGGDC
jgi:hypothetical protein